MATPPRRMAAAAPAPRMVCRRAPQPRGCGVCRVQQAPAGAGPPDSASRGSTAAHADADGTVSPIPSPAAGSPQTPSGTVVSRCRLALRVELPGAASRPGERPLTKHWPGH